jgi:hypothetical protein
MSDQLMRPTPTAWNVAGMAFVKMAFALGALAGAASPRPALAQRAVDVSVLNFKLVCDRDQCRTPVLELHEATGADESSVEYVFAPPPGITFDEAHTTGVEVDGAGADHYVRALAGPGWLKCKWLAKAKAASKTGSTDGFAKGYCWIGIKK